jgi:subfamily B ATP-binding cassette protein HlyB/CyaB
MPATPADGLYIVRVRLRACVQRGNGKEISMGVRKAGEVFAELAMLRSYRHELSARAALKTELWFIPRTAIEPVVGRNPAALDFINNYVAISSAGGWWRACSTCAARSASRSWKISCAASASSASVPARKS